MLKIVLGFIERRTLSIEPRVEETVRDTLKFELSRKGYTVLPLDGKINYPSAEDMSKILSSNTAELFVEGMIVENTTSDAFDTKSVSLLSISIYNVSGELISQIRETSDDDIAKIRIMNTMISGLVDDLDKNLTRISKRGIK